MFVLFFISFVLLSSIDFPMVGRRHAVAPLPPKNWKFHEKKNGGTEDALPIIIWLYL